MKIAEPKFKIDDEVKTNNLYHGSFPEREPYTGKVTKVYTVEIPESHVLKSGYIRVGMRIEEIIIMVSVDNRGAINQDYFELVKV